MGWHVGFEFDGVVPWSGRWKSLRFFVAKYRSELSILGGNSGLLVLVMSLDGEVGGRPANSTVFVQLGNYPFLGYSGNRGVFLSRVDAPKHYGKVFDVNGAMGPTEVGFKCS